MYSPALYKMASSDVVEHENSRAKATTIASFNRMKYTATSRPRSERCKEWRT